jgi:hypothetical protein
MSPAAHALAQHALCQPQKSGACQTARLSLLPALHRAVLTLVLLACACVCVRANTIPRVPVLCYHQMNSISSLSVTSAELGRQMDALRARGYQSITPDQYVKWIHGDVATLPPKPILITFDDGIANALPAVDILRTRGYVATMYAVSGFADFPQGWNLDWAQLAQLKAAGWTIQLHAGPNGHGLIRGQFCSTFYACRLPGESVAEYQTRVAVDLNAGEQALHARGLISVLSLTFSAPFDDLGFLTAAQDPVPAAFLDAYLSQRFAVVFNQRFGFRAGGNHRYRFELTNETTLDAFVAALDDTRFDNPFPNIANPPTPSTTPATATVRSQGSHSKDDDDDEVIGFSSPEALGASAVCL